MEILRLPDEVVDKIAAGEVVERPAHMVKELIENSLDAKAQQIQIEIFDGGRGVQIIDDGIGIPKNQLANALQRHATSKIREFSDLSELNSFGFRGEALATIGAVSCLEIVSRPEGQMGSYGITCEFGKMGRVVEMAGNLGTQVRVRDLFANVPARLKFLRSAASEIAQISHVVMAAALSHPEVEFRFLVNGRLEKVWKKSYLPLERVQQVLEIPELYEGMAEVSGYHCKVFFAAPDETRTHSRGIWLFVQNRWVQDRGLLAAVMDAYRSLLMHGEYPVVVVRLQCDPSEVDVNVHPTKAQVRFRDSRAAFNSVHRSLRWGLEKMPWNKKSSIPQMNVTSEPLKFGGPEFETTVVQQKILQGSAVVQQKTLFAPSVVQEKILGTPAVEQQKTLHAPAVEYRRMDTVSSGGFWSRLHLIGQTHLTYLVAESEASLVLIDQHAAHERICYERLMQSYTQGPKEIQNFLLPLVVNLPAPQVEALMNLSQEFLKLGIEFEQGGVESLILRSAPTWITESAIQGTLSQTGEEICERGGSLAFEKHLGEVCARLACHSAIRAGQALSMEEMKALLVQMDECSFSNYCPHGRPVSVEISWAQMERNFGRIL